MPPLKKKTMLLRVGLLALVLTSVLPLRALAVTPTTQPPDATTAADSSSAGTAKTQTPDLVFKPNVPIPGIGFLANKAINVTPDLVARYFNAIYYFLVSLAGVLALAVIVFAGFQWINAGGNSEKISSAQNMIVGALVGLFLALFSYTLLQMVNPDLLNLPSIGAQTLIGYEQDFLEGDPEANSPYNILPTAGDCPLAPGGSVSGTIAQKAAAYGIQLGAAQRLRYFWGAKGVSCAKVMALGLPTDSHAKTNFDKIKREFPTTVPADLVCADCSGTVNYIFRCGAKVSVPASTESWQGSVAGFSKLSISFAGDFDASSLKPGDVVSWSRSTGCNITGHAMLVVTGGSNAQLVENGGAPTSAKDRLNFYFGKCSERRYTTVVYRPN